MSPQVTFENPEVTLYVEDVDVVAAFYRDHLGFTETYRLPPAGSARHVELTLGTFTLGLSARSAAFEDHGLVLTPGPPTAEIVLSTNEVDAAFETLIAAGAAPVVAPHDFLSRLRTAWVADPEGHHLHLVQRRPAPRT